MSDEQVVSVRLRRNTTSTPWGFRMQGGHEYGSPLYIQQVNPKSLSHRLGLQVGDRLLAIGPVQAHNMSHEQAKMEIIRAGNELDLLVQRNASKAIDQPDSRQVERRRRSTEAVEESTEYRGYTNPNVQSRSFKILQESLSYSEADEEGMIPIEGNTPGEGIVYKAYTEGKRRLEELSEMNPRNFTAEGDSPYRVNEHYNIREESRLLKAIEKRHEELDPGMIVASARVFDGSQPRRRQRTTVDISQSSVLSPAEGQQQYLQQAKEHYQPSHTEQQQAVQQSRTNETRQHAVDISHSSVLSPAAGQKIYLQQARDHYQPNQISEPQQTVVHQQRPHERPLKLINYQFEEQYGHRKREPTNKQKAVVSPQKSGEFIPTTAIVSSVAADLDLKIISPEKSPSEIKFKQQAAPKQIEETGKVMQAITVQTAVMQTKPAYTSQTAVVHSAQPVVNIKQQVVQKTQHENTKHEVPDTSQTVIKIKQQVVEASEPEVNIKQQVVEASKSEVNIKQQVAEVSKTAVNIKQQVAEVSKPEVNIKQQVAEVSKTAVNIKQQVAEVSKPEVNIKQQVAEKSQPVVNIEQQVTEAAQSEVNSKQQLVETSQSEVNAEREAVVVPANAAVHQYAEELSTSVVASAKDSIKQTEVSPKEPEITDATDGGKTSKGTLPQTTAAQSKSGKVIAPVQTSTESELASNVDRKTPKPTNEIQTEQAQITEQQTTVDITSTVNQVTAVEASNEITEQAQNEVVLQLNEQVSINEFVEKENRKNEELSKKESTSLKEEVHVVGENTTQVAEFTPETVNVNDSVQLKQTNQDEAIIVLTENEESQNEGTNEQIIDVTSVIETEVTEETTNQNEQSHESLLESEKESEPQIESDKVNEVATNIQSEEQVVIVADAEEETSTAQDSTSESEAFTFSVVEEESAAADSTASFEITTDAEISFSTFSTDINTDTSADVNQELEEAITISLNTDDISESTDVNVPEESAENDSKTKPSRPLGQQLLEQRKSSQNNSKTDRPAKVKIVDSQGGVAARLARFKQN